MDDKLTKFVIKYSIISSIAVFVIGGHLKDFSSNLIDLIIEPLFSIDLNNDGNPDLKELDKFNLRIGSITFPLGKIFLIIIKIFLEIIVIYYIVLFILKNTKLVKV